MAARVAPDVRTVTTGSRRMPYWTAGDAVRGAVASLLADVRIVETAAEASAVVDTDPRARAGDQRHAPREAEPGCIEHLPPSRRRVSRRAW